MLAPAALLLLVAAWIAPQAEAQALKVGYTDHELIIVNMQEYQDIRQQLQQDYQTRQADLQAKAQDFQERLDRYQKQQALLSPERRQEREAELTQLQSEIQQEAAQADQALGEREAELMEPILAQVKEAIDAVAQEKGLDLVLRMQVNIEPILLYANEETVADITLDVARRLGIDVSEDETAAMN